MKIKVSSVHALMTARDTFPAVPLDSMDASGGSVHFRDLKMCDSFDNFAQLEPCLQELQDATNIQLQYNIIINYFKGLIHCLQAVLGRLTMRDTLTTNPWNFKTETHNSDARTPLAFDYPFMHYMVMAHADDIDDLHNF